MNKFSRVDPKWSKRKIGLEVCFELCETLKSILLILVIVAPEFWLADKFAECFPESRAPNQEEHDVERMIQNSKQPLKSHLP